MIEGIPEAAAAWLREFELPPAPAAGGKDLQGHVVRLYSVRDEETLRFFFPLRSMPFSDAMIK